MEFVAMPFFLSFLLLSQVQSTDKAPEFDAPQEMSPSDVREFDGVIEAYREIQLGAPVDGILETVNVERGDVVKKGQIIATLEAKIERATLEIAEAIFEIAIACPLETFIVLMIILLIMGSCVALQLYEEHKSQQEPQGMMAVPN